MYYGDYYDPYATVESANKLQSFLNGLGNFGKGAVAALIIGLIAAIVGAIFFLNRKRYENSVWSPVKNWFFRLVNFDMYVFSAISKFLYMFFTVFVIVLSLVGMFQEDGFLPGLLMLVILPIAVRLIFEGIYLFFGIRDQLSSVNRTLLDIKQGKGSDAFAAPVRPAAPAAPAAAPAPVRPVAPAPAAPVRPAAPAPAAAPRPAAPIGAAPVRPAAPAQTPAARRFCPKCGAEVKNGAPFCTNCGAKMG